MSIYGKDFRSLVVLVAEGSCYNLEPRSRG
jgi:hypothetical protein